MCGGERTQSKLRELTDPDLNTAIRLCKNDELTRNRTEDRGDVTVHEIRFRGRYSEKKNFYENDHRNDREEKEHVRRDKKERGRYGHYHVDRTCPVQRQTCRKTFDILKRYAEERRKSNISTSHNRHREAMKI